MEADEAKRVSMLEHVLYEISGYINGYLLLSETETSKFLNATDVENLITDATGLHARNLQHVRNLITDATGLHARNLIESFTDKKCENKDTIKINEYYKFNEQLSYCNCNNVCITGSKFKSFSKLYRHLCNICNHISKTRQQKTEPSWNECFEFFNKNMLPHINRFILFLEGEQKYQSEFNQSKFKEIKEQIEKIQSEEGLHNVTDTATTYTSSTSQIQG